MLKTKYPVHTIHIQYRLGFGNSKQNFVSVSICIKVAKNIR